MRSILAVSDLTPASDGALSATAALAARTGAALHVVHALEIVGMPLGEALRTDVGSRIADAESALAEQVRRAVPGGPVPASCVLDFHAAEDAVLRRARRVGADLVVFAAADPRTARGARHLRALEGVAGAADAPCLLVRNPLPRTLARVLLPLSAAEMERGVLDDACDRLAEIAGPAAADGPAMDLVVLHVASGWREWRMVADLDREIRRAASRRPWDAWLRIRRGIRGGEAAHMEILRVACEAPPDLVVLGPGCGLAGAPAFVEEARAVLLRRLPCSVLVLPGTIPDDDDPPPPHDAAGRGESEPVEALPAVDADEPALASEADRHLVGSP